jgi:hypothetical protein
MVYFLKAKQGYTVRKIKKKIDAVYTVFQKSLYLEEKSNSALLRTVIPAETCLNALKHISV